MRRKPELMQLEIGMSTSRYFPASGTAGFARSFVSGNSRLPCPPPMMTQRTLLTLMDWRPVCDIANFCRNHTVEGWVRASNRYASAEIRKQPMPRARCKPQIHRDDAAECGL